MICTVLDIILGIIIFLIAVRASYKFRKVLTQSRYEISRRSSHSNEIKTASEMRSLFRCLEVEMSCCIVSSLVDESFMTSATELNQCSLVSSHDSIEYHFRTYIQIEVLWIMKSKLQLLQKPTGIKIAFVNLFTFLPQTWKNSSVDEKYVPALVLLGNHSRVVRVLFICFNEGKRL